MRQKSLPGRVRLMMSVFVGDWKLDCSHEKEVPPAFISLTSGSLRIQGALLPR